MFSGEMNSNPNPAKHYPCSCNVLYAMVQVSVEMVFSGQMNNIIESHFICSTDCICMYVCISKSGLHQCRKHDTALSMTLGNRLMTVSDVSSVSQQDAMTHRHMDCTYGEWGEQSRERRRQLAVVTLCDGVCVISRDQ